VAIIDAVLCSKRNKGVNFMSKNTFFWVASAVSILFSGCIYKKADGTSLNPMIWGFVPASESPIVQRGIQSFAELVQNEAAIHIQAKPYEKYEDILAELSKNPPRVQIATLPALAYIEATKKNIADASMVALRFGSPVYRGQIVVRRESEISKVSDLKGKSFARPDPYSASGWILPMLHMETLDINTEDLVTIIDVNGHSAVIKAVYRGEADAGASYADARRGVLSDYPDVFEKLKVIFLTEYIPNDGIQFSPTISTEMRKRIEDAVKKVIGTEAGKSALFDAFAWDTLILEGDSYYDSVRSFLDSTGVLR
jgi:phosphonate transport system substrate-binding protein